ncbi:hypothetical protein MSTE_02646 [Mycobacteroides stephanolepidis]|uniref:Uncharacterized protein n=1 Tax=[Mycobacterium] stephanolepidis TaxID=1520670 RepID=A0A1Z4EYA5_9MYCO|nr:hypothetical protein MSTE_02646 [[Mycobacterium] stephanolepidis]
MARAIADQLIDVLISPASAMKRPRRSPSPMPNCTTALRCAPGPEAPAICTLSINSLCDAHRSGAPVLAIASHIPSTGITYRCPT